jgi:hypothetical protein
VLLLLLHLGLIGGGMSTLPGACHRAMVAARSEWSDGSGITVVGLQGPSIWTKFFSGAWTIEVIQKRLGHASIRTTADVYGSLPMAVDKAASDRLNEMYESARGHGRGTELRIGAARPSH